MNREMDRTLFLSIFFLLGLGLVQIYSSSFIFAIESFNDGLFFVKKQALFVIFAIATLFVTAYIPWKWIERIGLVFWILSVLGVALTLVPSLGIKAGGASRWLNLGAGYRIEPSEILKYTYPVLLAYVYSWRSKADSWRSKADSWRSKAHANKSITDTKPSKIKANLSKIDFKVKPLVLALMALLPLVLLLFQPDFGSVAIIAIVLFTIAFSQGLKWRYAIAGMGALTAAAYFLIVRVDYRMARVASFLDPWADPAKKGFQVIQSMLGFYAGGVSGVGLGQGQGKLFFLPEAHTDFTLSVLGEELGFLGILGVLSIFGYIGLRGLQISVKAKDERARIVALGVTLMFSVTAMINAGVAMGMLPTKGLGMPFLSYGGSALLSTCFGLGLLLNIDRMERAVRVRSFIKIKNESK